MALARLFGSSESRSLTSTNLFLSGMTMPTTTQAGVPMSQDASLKVNSIFAAVNLISDSVAMLPRDTFTTVNGDRQPYRPRPVPLYGIDMPPTFWRSSPAHSLAHALPPGCPAILRTALSLALYSARPWMLLMPRQRCGGGRCGR